MGELFLSTGSRRQIYEGVKLGEAHYSYNVVFQRFLQSFILNVGRKPYILQHPEIYKTELAKAAIGSNKSAIHIAFKSPEDLRLLDGAYNISHVAWEFNSLPKFPGKKVSPLAIPRFALSLVDEIWVGCEFTRNVFIQEGLLNVHVIPAPIPLPSNLSKLNIIDAIGDLQALQLNFEGSRGTLIRAETKLSLFRDLFTEYYKAKKPKIYLTVANIWDYRKNIPQLVKLFKEFHSVNSDTALVIKLVLDNKNTRLNNINEIFALHFSEWISSGKCDGIYFISDDLSDEAMNLLMRASDFYLNLSRAEGQCLPILEAMASGIVPISVDHTAMFSHL